MTIKERNQQLRVVAELLTLHIPEQLPGDPDLARDLLSVAATALQTISDDAEKSAQAWDKRAYDLRADELRREWGWALGTANYALGLVLRPQPLQQSDIDKGLVNESPISGRLAAAGLIPFLPLIIYSIIVLYRYCSMRHLFFFFFSFCSSAPLLHSLTRGM